MIRNQILHGEKKNSFNTGKVRYFSMSNKLQQYVIKHRFYQVFSSDHSVATFALNSFPGERHGPSY